MYERLKQLLGQDLRKRSESAQAPTPLWWQCRGFCFAMVVGLSALLFCRSEAAAPAAEAAPSPSLPIAHNYAELWQLGQSMKSGECAVQGRIYVLCYFANWRVIWVWWDGTVSYLDAGADPLPISSGDWIDLDGLAEPAGRGIIWTKTKVTRVTGVPTPEPLLLREDTANLDEVANHPAAIEGVVDEQIQLDNNHISLNIVFGATNALTFVALGPKDPLPQLVGTKVRATGVLSVKKDVSNVAPKLEFWCASPASLKVIGVLARDERFAIPVTEIDKVVVKPRSEVIHVSGIVHRQETGRFVILRDATGQIEVLTRQNQFLREGESVEAIGRPSRDGVALVLREGLVRRSTAPATPMTETSLLRLSDQVRALSPAEVARGMEARISGIVTWSTPRSSFFFIQDATGGLKVLLPNDGSVAPPFVGAGIIVSGKVHAGEFVPALQATAIVPGDNMALRDADTISWETAMTGGEYGNWVELQAYVRSVSRRKDECRLELTASGGEFTAALPPDVADEFTGAIVRVRGVCDALANDRRQLVGFRLLVPGSHDVRVVEPAPADPFATPVESIGNLMRYNANTPLNRRVQVRGTVLLHIPEQLLYVQDGSDSLLILSRQSEPLHPGDRVGAVGIPGQDGGRLIMRDAVYRREGVGALAEPKHIDGAAAPSNDWDGQLVAVSGRLLNFDRTTRALRLQLQVGNRLFTARLEGQPATARYEIGSELGLVGVYRVERDEYRSPRGFVVNLRSAGDITVLATPPWWTLTRVVGMAAVMLAVALLAVGWSFVLSRKNNQLRVAEQELRGANEKLEARVAARTRDLSAEVEHRRASEQILAQERLLLRTLIDNLPAYLYVKDTEGRFVIDNLPHARLLGATRCADVIGKTESDFWPPELADERQELDRRVMATGTPLVLHEEPYVIGDKKGWHSTTKVPLRDAAGRLSGLIAIEQDITARKEVEADRENLHRQLLETSRQAGMAEVATGVLHNIGNVLNSVNISAALATEIVVRSKAEKLRVLVDLLTQHQNDLAAFFTQDRRAQRIPEYLTALAEQLRGEQSELLKELSNLQQNIDHIKQVVAMQQTYAKISGVTERVPVEEIVEDALRINAEGLVRHRIEIIRHFRANPIVVVERHKVLQILVNLISNAKYACDGTPLEHRRVTIGIDEQDERVSVSVQDNGVGIRTENLTRIFSHGFTTRKNGHGFGLHSGALAAKDLGGALKVTSEGEGRGATFTLEIPLRPKETASLPPAATASARTGETAA
jgi:PAS domain S-box-containing protein